MNSKLLLILPLMICLSACATTKGPPRASCLIITPDPTCDGDKNFPIITINTQAGLVVDRSNACVTRGSTIEFRVVPPGKNDVGSVSIRAKHPTDTWLNGTNSPDKKEIKILVPDWVTAEKAYDYDIYIDGGTCMDPRVEVLD